MSSLMDHKKLIYLITYRSVLAFHNAHASRLTPHASRLTPHASRLTPHASRLTPHASRLIIRLGLLPSNFQLPTFILSA